MKVAIILGAFSIGTRPLDFNTFNIWTSPRGLTGTDLTTIMISIELSRLSNEVHLFTIYSDPNNRPTIWEGIHLHNFDERFSIIDDTFDTILSINEPNVFKGLTTKPLRICWQFLNDFSYCDKDFDDYVDKWLGVCQPHVDYLKTQLPPTNKWDFIGLGCSPEWYQDNRVPGRVVWCSSADRGLHWLLQEWPKIRAAVPYATLKIFYHFNFNHVETIEPNSTEYGSVMVEMGNRIRYAKDAMRRLKDFGVEHIGSTSRDQMKKEFSEASVLGYSCDTLNFSEGFSVTTLEAHASSTVPIITDVDCLGHVYEHSGAIIIKSPVKNHLEDFTNSVIKSLTDKKFSDDIISKCMEFARQNTWAIVAQKMNDFMKKGK